jgi:hypothetical protein
VIPKMKSNAYVLRIQVRQVDEGLPCRGDSFAKTQVDKGVLSSGNIVFSMSLTWSSEA